MLLLTGRLLMCTFLPGGERPFFLVGGVGIRVKGSVATFIRTSQSHRYNHTSCLNLRLKPACLAMTPRVLHTQLLWVSSQMSGSGTVHLASYLQPQQAGER